MPLDASSISFFLLCLFASSTRDFSSVPSYSLLPAAASRHARQAQRCLQLRLAQSSKGAKL